MSSSSEKHKIKELMSSMEAMLRALDVERGQLVREDDQLGEQVQKLQEQSKGLGVLVENLQRQQSQVDEQLERMRQQRGHMRKQLMQLEALRREFKNLRRNIDRGNIAAHKSDRPNLPMRIKAGNPSRTLH